MPRKQDKQRLLDTTQSSDIEGVLHNRRVEQKLSPKDDMCGAQGGYPTREGSKPWV